MPITVDIELPRAGLDIARADLTFYGLDHSGPSYEARVFLDRPDATSDTPLDDPGYAGSFGVFGHGGCFGEEGHCEVRPAVTTFDRRMPHPLVPAVRVLTCTDHIARLIADNRASVSVTVVAVVRDSPLADAAAAEGLPQIDQIALHTYE
jgi:tyrosinase